MEVRIDLPGLLAGVLGRDHLVVEAETLAGALAAAYAATPALRPLLEDEAGVLREHVLVLLRTAGGTVDSRWLEDLERPLEPGDAIVVMQAVSGG